MATPDNLTALLEGRSPRSSSRGLRKSPPVSSVERFEVYLQEDSGVLKPSKSCNSRRPASACAGMPSPPESSPGCPLSPGIPADVCPGELQNRVGGMGQTHPGSEDTWRFRLDPVGSSVCLRQAGVGWKPVYHPKVLSCLSCQQSECVPSHEARPGES